MVVNNSELKLTMKMYLIKKLTKQQKMKFCHCGDCNIKYNKMSLKIIQYDCVTSVRALLTWRSLAITTLVQTQSPECHTVFSPKVSPRLVSLILSDKLVISGCAFPWWQVVSIVVYEVTNQKRVHQTKGHSSCLFSIRYITDCVCSIRYTITYITLFSSAFISLYWIYTYIYIYTLIS